MLNVWRLKINTYIHTLCQIDFVYFALLDKHDMGHVTSSYGIQLLITSLMYFLNFVCLCKDIQIQRVLTTIHTYTSCILRGIHNTLKT